MLSGMSSPVSRSPGEPPAADAGETPSKRPVSAGRYSLTAATSDSTQIPAVRPPPLPPPPRGATPPAAASQTSMKRPSVPPLTPGAKPPSLRPPPPPKRESVPPSFSFDGFDEGSLAHAFDALMSEGTVGEAGRQEVDLGPVRELFAELAANHMRHVRDFMIDMKWGEAPRDWLEICVPAVTSLRRAADRLELHDLSGALDAFGAELATAVADPASTRAISGQTKELLLASYEGLVAVLPQAFALDRDRSQREAVIVQSLCLSVPDVRKVTIDKLHAAGLTSLSVLFAAKPSEIAQVAGIPESLAQRIVDRFQEYRRELQNASPQDARAAERERLAALAAQLREQHVGYEEAAQGWSPEAKAKKRDLFRAREETWLAVSLLLARFGEVERLQGIEKIPFTQRIERLEEYLEEARDMYRQ